MLGTVNSAAVADTGTGLIAICKVFVAYDFSTFAGAALEYGIDLARSVSAEVTIIHVEDPAVLGHGREDAPGVFRAEHNQVLMEMQALAQRVKEQGVRSSALCRAGSVRDVLVQLASELKSDVLVLGAYGHNRSKVDRLGSTAEFMLRCMPCVTVTMPPRHSSAEGAHIPMRQILYASSAPVNCGKAIRLVETLAHSSNASVEMVHVVDKQLMNLDSRSNSDVNDRCEELIRELREAGVDASWKQCVGSAAQEIASRAEEISADLIVFGVEHRASTPAVSGVISRTIELARCPVMTVPGPA